LALNFRLAVNMLQLIYALKKHNNSRFPTASQPRICVLRVMTTNQFQITDYDIFFITLLLLIRKNLSQIELFYFSEDT
jgi:hypothetical protein